MPANEPQKLPKTWTTEMLNAFHKLINSPLPVSFTVSEKNKLTTFFGKQNPSSHARVACNVSYKGNISVPEFENVGVVFNPAKNLTDEYKNFIGYIEIVNGLKEDTIPVPEIRVFIQEDSGVCDVFSEMLIESKTLHAKLSPIYIYLEQSYCLKDKPPEELLKKRIPIKEISTFQKISCVE